MTAPTAVPAARARADVLAMARQLVIVNHAVAQLAAAGSTAAHDRVALEQVHDALEAAADHLRRAEVKLDQVAREVG